MLCLSLPQSLRNPRRLARAATLGVLALGLILASAATASAATAAADLVAQSIYITPTTTYLGTTTFTMTVTIRNAGTVAAGAQLTRIWASKDSQINGQGSDDQLLFTLPVPALAAGKSVVFNWASTPKLIIDPNRVGPNGTDYLAVGTYYLGVQVDAFNQVPNETSESNFFLCGTRLNVKVKPFKSPPIGLPALGTDNVSVIRQLQWTTVTNANRYDLSLARLKDVEQRFFPRAMISTGTPAQRVVLTDLKGPYNPYTDFGVNMSRLPNNTPDVLIAQDNQLFLHNRVYDNSVTIPRYQKPVLLHTATYTTDTIYTSYMASHKFGPGIISALTAANMNFMYTRDTGGWDSNSSMDVVFATYMDLDGYNPSREGTVYVLMNKRDFNYPPPKLPAGIDTIANTTTDTLLIPLLNWRGRNIPGDNTHPYGIKSLVVADFDRDSDPDIMVGSDRYPGWSPACDKIVVFQSDYRNSPNGQNDPSHDFAAYMPRHFTDLNNTIEDAQDMAVGDFDRDDLPDVVLASYHGDRLWLLHNTTKTDAGVRTTRTLDFSAIGPLFTDDLKTTAVFRGANTVCVRDLNGDHQPDIVAGAYFDGKVVVYENQMSSGTAVFDANNMIPHVLATNLPNLEKVTTADMNGDYQYDIVVSSATNDLIVWYENRGNFQFLPHIVTKNSNRVGSIVVGDFTNDQMPDILSFSQYDKDLTLFISWPQLTGSNVVGRNLISPVYRPAQPFEFNQTYVWSINAKADTTYSTTSQLLTFKTQPTRINIVPKSVPESWIEPNAGLALELNTLVDGPQPVQGFGIDVYADPILDRTFLLANGDISYPPGLAPADAMTYIGFYDFVKAYQPGQRGFLTPKFDYTKMPEGLYNLYTVAVGNTPEIHDGVRNGIEDGIPDGIDNNAPWNIAQEFTNPTYGDDAYLAPEKLGVIYKPGMPEKPAPATNSVNVPTGTKLGWNASTYATGYDVYMNKAASALPQYTSVTVTNALTNLQSIAVGNLDMDAAGAPDVAAANVNGPGDARIYWMDSRNSGRSFGRNMVASNLLGAPLLQIADMDRDGKNDILAASSADGQIWWYKNGGGNPLKFSTPIIVDSGLTNVNSIQAIDMDGDGDRDVLAASSTGSKLVNYERRSNGTYSKRVIDANHGQALFARSADIDGDGDMDIIAAFWGPNSVAWYENQGGYPTQFTRHQISSTINNPRWLAAGDMDGDNDQDIVAVSQTEGKIYLFRNNGAAVPSFTVSVAAQGLMGPHGLALLDFNHDCRLDIATATSTGNTLRYFMNNGGTPPAFSPFLIQAYPSGVVDLAASDMDGDHFDEVAGAVNGGMINWFDYVVDYDFGDTMTNPLIKQNTIDLVKNFYQPYGLRPSMGYQWQVVAKRVIRLNQYGRDYGKLERVTTSSLWNFFTGQSDLVAKDLVFAPTSVEQGQTVHFTITESNLGYSDSAAHATDIWLSPDSTITRGGNDIFLARAQIGSIPAKGSRSVVVDVNTGALGASGTEAIARGNYYVGIYVDALNSDNAETTKENNKKVVISPLLQITKKNNVDTWTDYR